MATARIRTGIVVLACLVLTACGADITVRDAKPGPEKATVNVPTGGVVNPRDWPNACTFISDAEIKAILPQVENIKRTSDWVKVPDAIALGGKAGVGLSPHGQCEYSFKLPQNGEYRSNYEGTGRFTVKILAVGDPKLLARYFVSIKAVYNESSVVADVDAGRLGADECFDRATSKYNSLSPVCRRGPLMFESYGADFLYIDFENAKERTAAFKSAVDERVTPAFYRAVTANF
jgi:hypothetical protein